MGQSNLPGKNFRVEGAYLLCKSPTELPARCLKSNRELRADLQLVDHFDHSPFLGMRRRLKLTYFLDPKVRKQYLLRKLLVYLIFALCCAGLYFGLVKNMSQGLAWTSGLILLIMRFSAVVQELL